MTDTSDYNMAFLVAGGLSFLAAIMHVAVVFGGPDWYRTMGAGEQMAQMAERGHLYPTIITLFITCVLFVWAQYAFAAAGLTPHLPLMKPALLAITAVYLLRGLAPAFIMAFKPAMMDAFWIWSSLICLVFGITHLVGLWQAWDRLG